MDEDNLDEHEISELTKEVAKRLERRGVLHAGAGLAAGGAAGYLASGRAEAGSNQTGTIGSGGSPVDVVAEDIYGPGGQGSGDSVVFEAVETDQLEITNKTFISAHLDSRKSGISSNNFTNIIDTEDADVTGEFNGSYQFVPNESGWYWVVAQAKINPGSDGDTLRIRLFNTTDSSQVLGAQLEVGGNNFQSHIQIAKAVELTSGKAYEAQADDFTSSYDIFSGRGDTFLSITRSVIQP